MQLYIYNSLERKKVEFQPIAPPFAGIYVCGPTVYGDPHLGHARPAITFDLLFRLLKVLGYKVRYVRNITDVGHLEIDAYQGEDKIAKKARLESLEPMEVAAYYTNRYRDAMKQLAVLPPSIEPLASGHIIEQIEMVKRILDAGFAYESNGSIYFDVIKYDQVYGYGKLSGRVLDDMKSGYRQLDGQDDKRSSFDFALWKKASPSHIMRWPSPWGDGFPGWHMECSAMSAKYLGERFDIHGGGMDLIFPHHECEIAQSTVVHKHPSAKYWMHNNMITINGQKMGKSLGNFITLEEMFNGTHKLLEKAYSPMTVRFFILQAHYRSTLDFSNDALQAAEKGIERIFKANDNLDKIKPANESSLNVNSFMEDALTPMCDDLNSSETLAVIFDWVKKINSLYDGSETLTNEDLEKLKKEFRFVLSEVLGMQNERDNDNSETLKGVIDMILNIRMEAKARKEWATSDLIRKELENLGVVVKDKKDGFDWELGSVK